MFVLGWWCSTLLLNRLTIGQATKDQLLITLGLSLLIVNVLLMIFGGRPHSVPGTVRRVGHGVRARRLRTRG